jgi:hypothetical protein
MKTLMRTGLIVLAALAIFVLLPLSASADDDTTSLKEFFKQGTVEGQLKTYFFAQSFDGDGLNDSEIWVNGGNLSYKTAKLYGFRLGATFQASFVGHKDDEDGKTAGTMDADGAVLSEAYLAYKYTNTRVKLNRQYISGFPLLSGSGSRMIRESFTGYLVQNEDIPGTVLTAGLVTEYQKRTDGAGDIGDFDDIGDDGMIIFHASNTSVKDLALQFMYANILDDVIGYYADAKYTIDVQFKPYVAAQIYYTDYDDDSLDSNSLYGLKAGMKITDFDLFAGYTSSGGDLGDARVFRGIGQGAYYVYTATTKSSGFFAYDADTTSYQIGAAYKYMGFAGKFRFSIFDSPAANSDLDEYTLNLLYKFSDWAEGFSVSVDFTLLDYENDDKDATDLRTRLIYSF